MDTWRLVDGLRYRPGMFLPAVTYDALAAYIEGCDTALSGGLLHGFKEFVELKLRARSNVIWWALIPRLCGDDDPTDEQKMTTLLDVLEEFLTLWRSRGPAIVYSDWLELPGREVEDDLLRFGVSPVGETVSLRDATTELRVDRQAFLEKARDRAIRLGLRDGEVHIRRDDLEALKQIDRP